MPLAIAADIVHLSAMAVWGGGLVMLAAFTLRGPSSRTAALAVRRFSPIALGCVAALAVSGGYMAWRLIGTWGALFGTTYGLLVIAKSAGFAILVCLGYLARRFIHRRLLRIDDVAEVDDQAADAPPAVVPAHPAQAEPTVQAESTVQAAASGELALATVIAGHTAASRAAARQRQPSARQRRTGQ